MKTVATITAAWLALGLQGGFAAAHAAIRGHCTGMSVTDYVISAIDAHTVSTSFVAIPDGYLTFTTASSGCVLITFSAVALANPPTNGGEALHVRTLLDGKSLCTLAQASDDFSIGYSPPPGGAYSITRICGNVAAGTHTVRVQMRTENGNGGDIYGHVLAVTHH